LKNVEIKVIFTYIFIKKMVWGWNSQLAEGALTSVTVCDAYRYTLRARHC